jgi:hypothetical protein
LRLATSCQEDDEGGEGFDCEFHFGFVRKRVCFWLRIHGIEMRFKMKDFWALKGFWGWLTGVRESVRMWAFSRIIGLNQ